MNHQQSSVPRRHCFESDTQRLVRMHLSDPNHIITEEDIASVRIGMTDRTTPKLYDAPRNPEA